MSKCYICKAQDYTKLIDDSIIWKYVSCCILLFSILAIELIIYWNSISNVYNIRATGQIIPFIIGAGGLCKVVFTIFVQMFNDESVVCTLSTHQLLDGQLKLKSGVRTMRRSGCTMGDGRSFQSTGWAGDIAGLLSRQRANWRQGRVE